MSSSPRKGDDQFRLPDKRTSSRQKNVIPGLTRDPPLLFIEIVMKEQKWVPDNAAHFRDDGASFE
jgi:hypothetical protein